MDNNASASRKMILKPASLKQQNGSSSSENGNSFAFSNNPFLKCDKDESEKTVESKNSSDPAGAASSTTTSDLFKPAKPSNLFTNATTLAENSNFVFGQNLHERVVMDKVPTTNTSPSDGTNNEQKDGGGLLFSSAIISQSDSNKSIIEEALTQKLTPPSVTTSEQSNENGKSGGGGDDAEISQEQQKLQAESSSSSSGNNKSNSNNNGSSSTNNMSLVEAARKYEEMKGAQKRKYEEVETITGEEDEENILEINCKLYTFENSNYEERGRGTLRLNDTKSSSRVVFRASGSYRVLLNTKVWRDQQCEKPSSKSLRLTAFNSEGLLKIYLVQGRVEDIESLAHELQRRIEREKNKAPINEAKEDDDDDEEEELKEIIQQQPPEIRVTDSDEIIVEPATKKLATNDE